MIDDHRMGAVRHYLSPPKDWKMRIPEIALKSVVFVGDRLIGGGIDCQGTGFFVGIPWKTRTHARFVYLVTAKHVADGLAPDFVVRMNTLGQGSTILDGGSGRWIFHPTDPFVDVAAFGPIGAPGQGTYEFIWIEEDDFLTSTEGFDRDVGLGDEVFVTGLFTELSGPTRNLPIVRIGHIAGLPAEKIPIELSNKQQGQAEAILIETHSISGLSGSPVFVNSALQIQLARGLRGPVNARFYLLGVMHGIWSIRLKDKRLRQLGKLVSEMNIGISVVVPAKYILEVLQQPALEAERERFEKMAQKTDPQNRPATPLSAKTKRKNRDVEIPPIARGDFFDALKKTTRKRKPSS